MRIMIRFFQLVCLTFILPVGADMNLKRLDEYDKATCLQMLEEVDLADLWNVFLSVQTDLFFNQEADWIANQKCWQEAKNVLELGSGNGAYLHKLSERFKDKNYLGIEKQPKPANQSNQNFGGMRLKFREGDAEIAYQDLEDQFDIVLFRLTLQHLKNPRLALEHAYRYLKDGGYVVIVDAFDPAKKVSHEMPSLEAASRQLSEKNKNENKGNRRITMEILEELQKGEGRLGQLYQVEFTSLNEQGQVLKNIIKFEDKRERKLSFTQALLVLDIFKKGYGVAVDFSKAYEELKVLLEDEKAWICPGMHVMILKKR